MKKILLKKTLAAIALCSTFMATVFMNCGVIQAVPVSDPTAYATESENGGPSTAYKTLPDRGTAEDLRAADPAQIAQRKKYDSRNYGIVTPVRDQSGYKLCWTYGTIAAVETAIVRAGLASSDLHLDEVVAANNARNDPDPNYGGNDPLGNNPSYYPENKKEWNSGSYGIPGPQVFSQWRGLIKYDSYSYGIPVGYLDQVANMRSAVRVSANITSIKNAVAKYGAVSASVVQGMDDQTYYCLKGTVTHVVAIIGWDDTVSADKFKGAATNDGAWIVKNSWGTNYHEEGYYYLSYEATITDVYGYEFMKTGTYDNLYFYDAGVNTAYETEIDVRYLTESGDTAKEQTAANIYQVRKATATTAETLKAVQLGLDNTGGYLSTAQISIYTGVSAEPDDIESTGNDPRSGKLVTTQTFEYTYPGYYTIDLNELIELMPNDWFSVVVTVENEIGTAAIYRDSDYKSANDLSYWYNGKTAKWESLNSIFRRSNTMNYGFAARIKALTDESVRTTPLQQTSISNASVELSETSCVYSGGPITPSVVVKNGNTVLRANTDYSVKYLNNQAVGEATVTVSGIGLYTDSQKVTFTINKAGTPPNKPTDQTLTYDQEINSIVWGDGWSLKENVTVSMGETKQVALIYYDTQNYENYETTVTVSRETAPTTPDPDTGDDTTGGSPDHSDNVNGDVDNSDENIAGGGSANGEGTDTETPDNETTTPEEGEHPAVSDGCASATVGVVPIIAAVGAWVFLKKRKQ